MVEEKVKEAFSKVKEEMQDLKQDVNELRQELHNISLSIETILQEFQQKNPNFNQNLSAEVPKNVPNFRERFKKEDFGTQIHSGRRILKNLNDLELKEQVSIGNEGVSALRQQIGNTSAHAEFDTKKRDSEELLKIPEKTLPESVVKQQEKDNLQENVERLKQAFQDIFRQLTRQEFMLFSLLYQLEDEFKRPVSYKELAARSVLTPNSIRDYISKLIAKKVPIIKEKYNNRQILLKIAPELRNIETLENLLKLVEED